MRVLVDVSGAAAQNVPTAKVREAMRMATLGYGLHRLGHQVTVVGVNASPIRSDPRYHSGPLEDLVGVACGRYDVVIVPDHDARNRHVEPADKVVLFKTHNDTNVNRDVASLDRCDVFVGHAFARETAENEKVLVMPHGVHDRVLKVLWTDGMLRSFLNDDLEALRVWYSPASKRDGVGFCGTKDYGRKAMVRSLMEAGIEVDVRWGSKTPTKEYIERLCSWELGLCLPGCRPGSYRFCECVLFGCAPVVQLWDVRYAEPITNRNAVVVRDWSDGDAVRAGLERLDELRAGADASYVRGWSPTGQARLLERLLSR